MRLFLLTDVFSPHGDGPAQLGHKLLGVQSDLDDVVEESEERSERERGHEQRDETELDDWREKNKTIICLFTFHKEFSTYVSR